MTRPRKPIQPDVLAIWLTLVLAWMLFWVSVFAAFAGDTYRWDAETYVYMTPSERPGVEAEILFRNAPTHLLSNYTFTLEIDGLAVDVRVEINASGADDLITVTPPPGFMAVPPSLLVPEDGGGRIDIVMEGVS